MRFEADNVPAEKLPRPAGWRLLIAPVKIEEQSKGGILLVDESVKTQEYFRNIAKVVGMGHLCYTDPKFQGGIPLDRATPEPWCKLGDVIKYNSYTGQELVINHDDEVSKLRVINDDEVIVVIDDLSVLEFI
jgi:co-chaperonin GroES (HSP10)